MELLSCLKRRFKFWSRQSQSSASSSNNAQNQTAQSDDSKHHSAPVSSKGSTSFQPSTREALGTFAGSPPPYESADSSLPCPGLAPNPPHGRATSSSSQNIYRTAPSTSVPPRISSTNTIFTLGGGSTFVNCGNTNVYYHGNPGVQARRGQTSGSKSTHTVGPFPINARAIGAIIEGAGRVAMAAERIAEQAETRAEQQSSTSRASGKATSSNPGFMKTHTSQHHHIDAFDFPAYNTTSNMNTSAGVLHTAGTPSSSTATSPPNSKVQAGRPLHETKESFDKEEDELRRALRASQQPTVEDVSDEEAWPVFTQLFDEVFDMSD